MARTIEERKKILTHELLGQCSLQADGAIPDNGKENEEDRARFVHSIHWIDLNHKRQFSVVPGCELRYHLVPIFA